MPDNETLHKIITEKLAVEVLKSLPEKDLHQYLSSAITSHIEKITDTYALKNAVEAAAVKKAVEIIETAEFQAKLEVMVRAAIQAMEPALTKAIAMTMISGFSTNRDKWDNSKFFQFLQDEVERQIVIKGEETKNG